MAYTGHGYHIPESNRGEGVTRAVTPTGCGGPDQGCSRCQQDVQDYREQTIGSHENYQQLAIDALRKYLHPRDFEDTPPYTIYVEMFTKTLKNWKAILGTTLDDCMLFVLVYDGENDRTHISAYHQVDNLVAPD